MYTDRVPYEPQRTCFEGSRTCGAAALAMVYRSLGVPCEQGEIWDRIGEAVRPGVRAARTSRLARDALERNFSAVILQSGDPLSLLERVVQTGVQVILNHRLEAHSLLGHFTVLLECRAEFVRVHDPHFGPGREFRRAELEQLWSPLPGKCEISGGVLVAIGVAEKGKHGCSLCGRELPGSIPCGRCGRAIPLRPAAAVGCIDRRCTRCRWNCLHCPFCDWAATPF